LKPGAVTVMSYVSGIQCSTEYSPIELVVD